jgi:hypothetical protein
VFADFATTVATLALAAAAPGSVTLTNGPVRATLSGDGSVSGTTLGSVSALTLRVERAGVVGFDGPLRRCRFGCSPTDPLGARFARLRVRDLDGDAEPEVAVERADGFNPCCSLEVAILRFDPATGTYREVDRQFGSTFGVTQLDGGGPAELVGEDLRFYGRFAPQVAGVFLPPQILHLLPVDGFGDVTARFPRRVARHARAIRRLLRQTEAIVDGRRRGNRDLARIGLRPMLAAYAADQRLLGHRSVGNRRLAANVARKRVSPAFRRHVLRFLRRHGYR